MTVSMLITAIVAAASAFVKLRHEDDNVGFIFEEHEYRCKRYHAMIGCKQDIDEYCVRSTGLWHFNPKRKEGTSNHVLTTSFASERTMGSNSIYQQVPRFVRRSL